MGIDKTSAGPAAPAQEPHASLPATLALRDSVLFLWCGRLVKAARRGGKLDAACAGAVLPLGATCEIDDQVGLNQAGVRAARRCISNRQCP
jgi:hypothetical protein